jgi:hypothetical protein
MRHITYLNTRKKKSLMCVVKKYFVENMVDTNLPISKIIWKTDMVFSRKNNGQQIV